MPHHPGDLFVAAKGVQARKQRVELRAAHQLVGRKAERIKIAGRAHRAELLGQQFRRHVARGAFEQASLLVAGAASQPEISHLDPQAAIDEQVAGLDVAVNDLVRMQMMQGLQAATERDAQQVQIERLSVGVFLQAGRHELQDQPTVRADHVIDGHDVAMFERSQELGLAPKSLQRAAVVEILLMDLLDGDFAAQLAVAAAIDHREIARGDLGQDLVAAVRFHRDSFMTRRWR